MLQDIYQTAKILIVDDQPSNILVLEQMLAQWGYLHVKSTTDPHEVLPLVVEQQPHALLLDLMMPGLDGFGVMRQVRAVIPPRRRLAIIVLTADISQETKRKALVSGAQDFLAKPFDAIELSLRLQSQLEINFLHDRLRLQNQVLEERVAERTRQLARSEHETAICLGLAGEYRDDETGHHTQRVGSIAALLVEQSGLWGNVHTRLLSLIKQAAPLHDVGKIGIPDAILLKPGPLTAEEMRVMKMHCRIGHGILSRHNTPLLQLAATIALTHHERWDGSGYPAGLAGEAIPIEGRIVAIADVFDALTYDRPYKRAWPVEDAIHEIQSQAGRQFDPFLVEVFNQSLELILQVRAESLLW